MDKTTSTAIAEIADRWDAARYERHRAQEEHGPASDEAVAAAGVGFDIERDAIDQLINEAIARCGRPVTEIERETLVNEAHEAFEIAGGDTTENAEAWGAAIEAASKAAERLVRHPARLWALAAVMLEEILLEQDPDPETSVSVKAARGVIETLAPVYRARHPEGADRFSFEVVDLAETTGS